MKPIKPNETAAETRHRTLLILWFGISMTILSFLIFAQFTARPAESNLRLTLMLNILAIVPVGCSFLFKQRILEKAINEQKLERVQVAYVLAWALCEMAALLGLMDHFVNGSPYYYVGFSLAALGMLLHFPRKQHLLDASPRQL